LVSVFGDDAAKHGVRLLHNRLVGAEVDLALAAASAAFSGAEVGQRNLGSAATVALLRLSGVRIPSEHLLIAFDCPRHFLLFELEFPLHL
jgi:hypothetical protein